MEISIEHRILSADSCAFGVIEAMKQFRSINENMLLSEFLMMFPSSPSNFISLLFIVFDVFFFPFHAFSIMDGIDWWPCDLRFV